MTHQFCWESVFLSSLRSLHVLRWQHSRPCGYDQVFYLFWSVQPLVCLQLETCLVHQFCWESVFLSWLRSLGRVYSIMKCGTCGPLICRSFRHRACKRELTASPMLVTVQPYHSRVALAAHPTRVTRGFDELLLQLGGMVICECLVPSVAIFGASTCVDTRPVLSLHLWSATIFADCAFWNGPRGTLGERT